MEIRRNGGLCLLLGTGLLTLCGCVEVAEKNKQFTYSVGLKEVGLIALIGLVLAICGRMARKRDRQFDMGLLLVGLGMLLVVAPCLALDRATLNETNFHIRTGFYGMTKYELRLDEIQTVEAVAVEKKSRRGATTIKVEHQFSHKDGSMVTLSLDNKLYRAARKQVKMILEEKGVEVPVYITP